MLDARVLSRQADGLRLFLKLQRRAIVSVAYNTEHGIDPQPLRKRIADITDMIAREDADTTSGSFHGEVPVTPRDSLRSIPARDLADLIDQLTEQMHTAAAELQFELAARLRDEVADLKKELRQMAAAGHA